MTNSNILRCRLGFSVLIGRRDDMNSRCLQMQRVHAGSAITSPFRSAAAARTEQRSATYRVSSATFTNVTPTGSYVVDIPAPYDRVNRRRKAVFDEPECYRNRSNIPRSDLAREGNKHEYGGDESSDSI
jgi:hypothetical protein